MSFPRYPEYKDSGVEWLGEVPAHWRVVRLGALFRESADEGGDDLPILSVSIHDGVSDREYGDDELDRKVTRSDDRSKYKRVAPGDLVYNMMRAWQGGFGTVEVHGMVSPAYIVARPTSAGCSRFVEQVLRTPNAVEEMRRYSNGVTDFRLRLYWDEFKSIAVPMPPPADRESIDAYIKQETAKIDALIAEQEKLIELLKEKRQAVISHAVTKGLDPNVPMKDSGVEWLGEVPEHWRIERLKRIASIRYGIGEPPRYQEAGVPLIRATNVNSGRVTWDGIVFVDPSDIPAGRIVWLSPGDIVVVRSGAYTGDSALIAEEHCPSIAGFDMVLRPVGCASDFLQYALLSTYLKSNQIDVERLRAAQPHLNAEELGACFLLLPDADEQRQVITFLDRETAKIDALVAEAESTIDLLKERRAALISAAVTGQIDVRKFTGGA